MKLTRVRRRGFSREVRRGCAVQMVDTAALAAIKFMPFAVQRPGVPLRIYIVERRSARFLWLRAA